jgi:4-diphosphocytidyl-2-C-methyl-D-erythritol kinase
MFLKVENLKIYIKKHWETKEIYMLTKSTKLNSFAKINLFLNIVSKRPDGYHEIQSIMQTIGIKDEIEINYAKKSIKITCTDKTVPTDFTNTAYKAAEIIIREHNLDCGVEISINKAIPHGAGLAGGSGNAAAVIIGMNNMFGLSMNRDDLIKTASKIGADVPYCLFGGTYLSEGIGDKLKKINDFKWDYILVVKPDFAIATKDIYALVKPHMYNRYDIEKPLEKISLLQFADALKESNNILEDIAIDIFPEIGKIKYDMNSMGAVQSIMTGSGSAVVGFFNDYSGANACAKYMKEKYKEVYITNTVKEGIRNGEEA